MANTYSVELDLRMRLMIAAINTKHDILLHPLPTLENIPEGQQWTKAQIDDLSNFFKDVVDLAKLDEFKRKHAYSVGHIQTLKWFEDSKQLKLIPTQPSDLPAELQRSISRDNTEYQVSLINIFKVQNLKPTLNQQLFELHKQIDGLRFGFHGSPFMNWHSILHNGLAAALNKRSSHGPGSYLSTNLKTSLAYSNPLPIINHLTIGKGPKTLMINPYSAFVKSMQPINPVITDQFPGSHLPKHLSCVSICEAINYKGVDKQNSFLVVPNDDMVRLEYLLLFGPGPTHASHKLTP